MLVRMVVVITSHSVVEVVLVLVNIITLVLIMVQLQLLTLVVEVVDHPEIILQLVELEVQV